MRSQRAVLCCGLLCIAATAAGLPAQAADARIVLDDGRVVEGRLRPLQESRYLVQGREGRQEVVLELPAAKIVSVDGRSALPSYDPRQPLRRTESVETVAPDGSVTAWHTMELRNEGRDLLTRVSWGVAAWERERSARMRVRDAFGNELQPRLEPRGEGLQAIVELAVPVVPLQTLALSIGYRDEGLTRREGDAWVYTFRGDFPEDRLLSRTVLLPAGATVIAVEPAASFQLEHAGAPLVFWRRYYAAGEELPLTLRYRLP